MEAIQVHRWTREQYEQLSDTGIFDSGIRVELIDGEIIEMSPQRSVHATAIRLVQNALQEAFGAGFDVRPQLPLALGEFSLPEPDLAVVRGSPREYRDAHPSEAVLVVEVAESSLPLDRGRKLQLYARSEIPEYWIVNLGDLSLEVYRDPAGDVYRFKSTYSAADRVSPVMRPESTVIVADLLP